ncbi:MULTISPECIES: hypothetical protein [Methanobrevibacter]|uniref:hypothetical protein n=1 Tax=Methanobrevibacter TaxID=2172 RepID=UPI0025D26472|nr:MULTISPECIES: hypothetical protein [Methanobrevibacter]MCI7427893.1 hypothetical protein [Methanobrevibacter sp.]MDD6775799.1 hypothetical protein [Methanobacteriaceae archaeon]MDY3096190.1 hypothetical protein [Methanobrevibacter sp.]
MKNGKINKENDKLKRIIRVTRKVSITVITIISIDKTLLASVKIAPLNKNSLNLDKYASEILLSKNKATSSIILNFMEKYYILKNINPQ